MWYGENGCFSKLGFAEKNHKTKGVHVNWITRTVDFTFRSVTRTSDLIIELVKVLSTFGLVIFYRYKNIGIR